MPIPSYPDFAPISLAQQEEIHHRLNAAADGISEFTFSNLYLFRKRYQYRVASVGNNGIIISGTTPPIYSKTPPHDTASSEAMPSSAAQNSRPSETTHFSSGGTKFFMTPCGFPGFDALESLLKSHDYWKNIPPSLLESSNGNAALRPLLEERGIEISEDRDNFDYLYLREELAALSGKRFHKKKNLVNAFMNAWPEHEQRFLEPRLIHDAQSVLERWREDKGEDGDYFATKEALEHFSVFNLQGAIYYAGGKPAAFCLGESVANGTMFTIHFEKALEQYKGIYQYMNQAFAASLPPVFTYLNREQDLGSEGLRQAKMTYRPVGFVKKYRGVLRSFA
jgi:hypothetical protein